MLRVIKFNKVACLPFQSVSTAQDSEVWPSQNLPLDHRSRDVAVLAVIYSGMSRNVDLYKLEVRVSNRLIEIDRVNAAFNEFAERHAVPAKLRRKINLVFDELLNNIITYAYEDEDEHFIEIDIRLSPSGLAVTVTDDGKPFNPFDNHAPDTALSVEDRPIGGLGVHLVRNVMDRVGYERHGENNVVLLEKELESSQEA